VPQLLGCSLAAAPKVRDLIGQGLTDIQDVGLVMYPWSCLVCCAGFDSTATSLAEHATAFLSVMYGGETPKPRHNSPWTATICVGPAAWRSTYRLWWAWNWISIGGLRRL